MAIIGIDLGPLNSVAAVWRAGQPVIIPDTDPGAADQRVFPSYVALKNNKIVAGELARQMCAGKIDDTARGFTRRVGTSTSFKLSEYEYSPEELTLFLLQKIKREAETFLGESVKQAVIAVPVAFDANQRSALVDACRMARLEPLGLISEPAASALAYGLDRLGLACRIAVLDLGYSTFSVTILQNENGVFEVLGTSDKAQLGGREMSKSMCDYLTRRLSTQSSISIRKDAQAESQLLEAIEEAKIELAKSSQAHISIEGIATEDGTPVDLQLDVKRSELEAVARPILELCRMPVEQLLQDIGLSAQSIDRVVLVGGPSCMPLVREFFARLFGKEPESGVAPTECVAVGAAIRAAMLSGELSSTDRGPVAPFTLGVETFSGTAAPIIPRYSRLPAKHSEIFSAAFDRQAGVTIHVVEGEQPMAIDNVSLGEFNLDGLTPTVHGLPEVEVTFDIDTKGELSVTAADVATHMSRSVNFGAPVSLAQMRKMPWVCSKGSGPSTIGMTNISAQTSSAGIHTSEHILPSCRCANHCQSDTPGCQKCAQKTLTL